MDHVDVTLLVNNAGLARTLDPGIIDMARDIFETNFYGVIRATQGFEISPSVVARRSLDGLESGLEEVTADAFTALVKAGLGGAEAVYLNPPDIA